MKHTESDKTHFISCGYVFLSEDDFLGYDGVCIACGHGVACYAANSDLVDARPEAKEWDWWVSCCNRECANHWGEGHFQTMPDWVVM